MQQFQDDIMKNRIRLEEVNKNLSSRIDQLEKRLEKLEALLKKAK